MQYLHLHTIIHPELSGCITTLSVCNTGGCKLLCNNGHLDRSRWPSLWYCYLMFNTVRVNCNIHGRDPKPVTCAIFMTVSKANLWGYFTIINSPMVVILSQLGTIRSLIKALVIWYMAHFDFGCCPFRRVEEIPGSKYLCWESSTVTMFGVGVLLVALWSGECMIVKSYSTTLKQMACLAVSQDAQQYESVRSKSLCKILHVKVQSDKSSHRAEISAKAAH